ncbi:MAG TPA: mycothiol conjugate amidase Mca [Tetrasphaera sp.]|uniref:mycothiol conjugate amidase Mca n=1 Tax=Nostocoides sp. TaxID=1917966 RepID=UPI002C8FA5DF|nr:mycothiol conjugate amidase Mca [Tetrasphaera sp.]HNQ06853.1 mycothiol conjugate amidase Mca [Tetrasphaera sp.]
MAKGMRLMCVHAHPDDESSKGAATMAKYVAAGAEVLVVSCTGGERGDILNKKLADDPAVLRDLAQVRRAEMAQAQAILGVDHHWLGFVDSGLPEGDPLPPLPEGCFALEPLEIPVEALVREIRRFRPHVMTTYDENGGYPHPDHIRCHDVSAAAFVAAGDPDAFPSAGPAWQPLKLYYNGGFSRARIETYHQALLDLGVESPYAEWLERMDGRVERTVTTRIECADFFEQRDQALLAHATQIDPDGFFFSVPREVQRLVWPFEDYEIAASYVPIADGEDDLFGGLDAVAAADALALAATDLALDRRVARVPA